MASGLWPHAAASESALSSLGAACDWLLQEEVSQPARAAHPLAGAAQRAAEGAPAARTLLWRCLDRSHTASCTECTAPPEPSLFRAFKLVTADGQSAEKVLRAQLSACPEWNDQRERMALATAPTTDASLAQVLRQKNCASVRKDHMLQLCRQWGYRSACWSPRVGKDRPARGSKRKAELPLPPPGSLDKAAPPPTASWHEEVWSVWPPVVPPVGPPVGPPSAEDDSVEVSRAARLPVYSLCVADPLALPPLLPLQDRTFQGEGIVATRVAVSVQPFMADVAEGFVAGSASTAFGAAQGAGMHWSRVRNMYGAVRLNCYMHEALKVRLGAVRRYRAGLEAEEGRTVAFSFDTRAVTPETELDALRTMMEAGHAVTLAVTGSHALPDGSLPPAEAAWLADYQRGHSGTMAVVAVLQSAIAQQRMGSLAGLLDTAEACITALIDYTVLFDESLRQRIQWMGRLCESMGAAAGDRTLALTGMALLDAKVHLRPIMGLPMHHPLVRLVDTP